MRPARPEPGDLPDTRAVVRCPGCGAQASAIVKAGAVRALDLVHEDPCPWLQAVERGVHVAPPRVEFLHEGRS